LKSESAATSKAPKPLRINEIDSAQESAWIQLMQNSIALGGGIVPGSLILLGGEPGIGKVLCYKSLKLP
jgi:DNA repair protein RadA/Sms